MPSPNGSNFDGSAAEMRDSPWLSAEDLMPAPGQKANVVIERVMKYNNVEFDKGRKKKEVYTLHFAGKQRELVLNATNRKSLVALFGVRAADWKGQAIQIYVTTTQLAGNQVPCIRIREADQPTPRQVQVGTKSVEQLEAEAADRAREQAEGGAS